MNRPEPTQTAVLDWVDAALADERVTAEDPDGREVQELALALAAERSEPDPEFAAALDERVAAGFPRERRGLAARLDRARGAARRRPRRLPMPALAGAATVLLAAAVGIGVLADQAERTDGGAPSSVAPSAAEDAEGDARGRLSAPGDLGPAPPGGAGAAPERRERRIERSAQLTLAAPDDELEAVADRIVAVADRHRGFVLRSSVSSGEDGASGGLFELRVPTGSLPTALRDLSALGEVRARSQSGQDITGRFVSVTDRLLAARAERRGLLRRLERAQTDAQADAIRRRLDLVAAEINDLRGQLSRLRERANYAQVTVVLQRSEGGGDSGDAPGGTIGDALDDALGSLIASVGFALRALGVLLPLAVVGAAGWLGVAVLRRRRRESALS